MSLRSIPVDADRIRFVAIDVEAVQDYNQDGTCSDRQRADQDGVPLWRVNTLCMVDGVAGGAKVGVDSQNPNRVALSVAFVPPGDPTGYVEATALIDKAEFVVGSAISLRGIFKGGGGSITSQPQGAQAPAQVGLLWGGTLTLEKVGFESGAVVQGALVSQWVEPSP